MTSRVLTRFYFSHIRKNATSPGGHVFKWIAIIFELSPDIISTNILTKFHKHWTKNVTYSVLTRFYYSHKGKLSRPPAAMFFNRPEPISN